MGKIIRLKQGMSIVLQDEKNGNKFHPLIIGESRGWWELREARTMDGHDVMIATKPDGSWYWVVPPKETE